MKKPADISINLVPKDPFFETPIGKILKWSLSVGRYIVIFTELVVIISFVTRFNLDRQVTDLNNTIHQKKTIIESYGTLEQDVRDVQRKIDQYKQIEQQRNISDAFPQLSDITPQDIELDQLTIKMDSLNFSGTAYSMKAFNLLINNIQLSPFFQEVVVDKVETGDRKDPGFHFWIRAVTQKTELKKQVTPPTQEINILDRQQDIEGL